MNMSFWITVTVKSTQKGLSYGQLVYWRQWEIDKAASAKNRGCGGLFGVCRHALWSDSPSQSPFWYGWKVLLFIAVALFDYKEKKVPRPNDSFAQSINGIGILKEYACESTYKSYINGRFIFKHNRFISSKFVSKAV